MHTNNKTVQTSCVWAIGSQNLSVVTTWPMSNQQYSAC